MMARTLAVVLIILTAAASRLLPQHTYNVTPVLAMAIFGGAYLRNRILSFGIPLAAMCLSDFALGYLTYGMETFRHVLFVYPCVLLYVLLGWWVESRQRQPAAIVSASLMGSILFYLITNFGVWAQQPWYPMPPEYAYPMNMQGLVTCYIMGIPFFWKTLLGDLGFTIVLFGGFWVGERILAARREPHTIAAPSEGGSTDHGGKTGQAPF